MLNTHYDMLKLLDLKPPIAKPFTFILILSKFLKKWICDNIVYEIFTSWSNGMKKITHKWI